ncbi:MAG: prepilin-type N-terminal cleavage/methylation domain-containing protein [Candidatus Acidiferrales bacterium]
MGTTMGRAGSRQSDKAARRKGGFSLIELLIVVAIILIIAAIAIPDLLRSKMTANEASAAESIHAILIASSIYYTTYDNGYPANLAIMGPSAIATCNQAGLIDPLLANAPNQKSGYTIGYMGQNGTVAAPNGCGTAGYEGFVATAVPITVGVTGARSFCSSEDGVLHVDPQGNAIASSAACDALQVLATTQ